MAISTAAPITRLPLAAIVSVAVLLAACGGGQVSQAASAPPSTVTASSIPEAIATSTALPTPAPTAVPSVTAKPAPPPAPWETYKSTKYHYVVSYPPFWHVWPSTGLEADMIDHSGYPQIFLSRFVDSATVSLDGTVKYNNAWYKSHYAAKVVSDKDVQVSGYRGRLVTYKGVDRAVKVTIVDLLLAKGRILYDVSIVGQTANAVADAALFKRLYSSFKPT